MVTENDIKTLSRYQTRSGKIMNWAMVIVPIFFFTMALLNLYVASKIGMSEGFDLSQLFRSWIGGIDVNAQYSGTFLAAMGRFTTALLHIGMTLILSVFAYAYYKRKKMDERILDTLRKINKSGNVSA